MNTFTNELLDLLLSWFEEGDFDGQRDADIVERLNEEGFKTERGRAWTVENWRKFRDRLRIDDETGKPAETRVQRSRILERAGLHMTSARDDLGYRRIEYPRCRS